MSPPGRRQQACRGFGLAAWVLLPLGACIVLAGLLLPGIVQHKLDEGIWRNIIWQPNSPPAVDARFRSNSSPGSPPDLFRVWMWNITNLEAVRIHGARPRMAELGPFTYSLRRERQDVMWDGSGRVRFKEYKHFHFEPSLSAATPDAPITTWNLPLLGVLAVLHAHTEPRLVPFLDLVASVIESYQASAGTSGLFTVRSAHELLFGYEDQLLATLARLLPPGLLPPPSIALLPNMTGPEEARAQGPMVFNTGARDPEHVWDIEADKGVTAVSSWPCGPEQVTGSDATQFTPGLTSSSRLRVWVGEVFRSAWVVVSQTVELAGVRLLRFVVEPSQLEPNPCYFTTMRGLFNVSSPMAGGPTGQPNAPGPQLLLSLPHFCEADARLAAALDGLACDPDKHSLFLDVEPTTGVTMRAFKRLQLNSRAGHLGDTLDPLLAPNLTIPIFWAEESGQALPEQLEVFKGSVYRAQWLISALFQWCSFIGGVSTVAGLIALVLARGSAPQQRLLDGDSAEPSSGLAGVMPRAYGLLHSQKQQGQGDSAAGGSAAAREPLLPEHSQLDGGDADADAVDVKSALDQRAGAGHCNAVAGADQV